MDDGSASVFCFTPLRVPVSELAPVAACPPSHSPSSESVCSAPPLPLGPCPVCPRLEQEFEAFRQAAYWKAMHGRALQREAQLKVENERLQALLRLREQQLFGRKTETSAATAPAASDSPPRRLTATTSRVASNAVGPVRNAAIIPTSLPLSKTRSCRPTSATARGVVSRSPIFQAPRIPQSWRSNVRAHRRVIRRRRYPTDLLVWCSSRHRHRPATGPADSQEHAGDLDLGDGALGQVSVLPADLSALWRTGPATAWTCRWAP